MICGSGRARNLPKESHSEFEAWVFVKAYIYQHGCFPEDNRHDVFDKSSYILWISYYLNLLPSRTQFLNAKSDSAK